MHYIDMHCDTMAELWYSRLRGKPYDLEDAPLMINLQKLREGDCLCQNFSMFINLDRPADFTGDWKNPSPSHTEEKMDPWYGVNEILKVFQDQMKKHAGKITQVTTGKEIHENLETGKMSALLTVEEGGVCKGGLDHLKALYDAGVRMMTLTWNHENELGSPNVPDPDNYFRFVPRADNGLKPKGKEFVSAMQDLGMIVDVSHLSDAGFYDVADIVKGPFVASHSNARAVCGCNRNLTDEMIRILAEHGGVTGLNFAPEFLMESDHPEETIEGIAAMAEHIRQVGGIECLGLGSDFDGIDGKLELSDASQFPNLAEALLHAGFTEDEVEKIFYKNVLRVYDEVL